MSCMLCQCQPFAAFFIFAHNILYPKSVSKVLLCAHNFFVVAKTIVH